MIQKIKAEVKRLMNNRDSRPVDGSYFDFKNLLSFIESLEKEPDFDDVDPKHFVHSHPQEPKNDGIMEQINNLPVFDGKITAKELRKLGDEINKKEQCGGDVNDEALQRQLEIWFEKGKVQARDEFNNLPKIKGWVARDDDLNHIHLFHNKPLRSKWTWACGYPALQLPDELFQDLKWEDEPIEVELTIHRV